MVAKGPGGMVIGRPRSWHWTRGESLLVLVLGLYFRSQPLPSSASNVDVVDVSETLRSLPLWPAVQRLSNFRNSTGVYIRSHALTPSLQLECLSLAIDDHDRSESLGRPGGDFEPPATIRRLAGLHHGRLDDGVAADAVAVLRLPAAARGVDQDFRFLSSAAGDRERHAPRGR